MAVTGMAVPRMAVPGMATNISAAAPPATVAARRRDVVCLVT
jgi:hypothetical protein